MRAFFALILTLCTALPARADLAPDPANPATPEGAVAWIAVIGAIAALIAIWWRRRR